MPHASPPPPAAAPPGSAVPSAEAAEERARAESAAEETWLRQGSAALRDGRYAVAARCFARLMVLAPHRAPAMHNLGEALRLTGRHRQAMLAYTRALRLRPDHPKALTALGTLLFETGSDRGAKRAVSRALVCDPAHAKGWSRLASLFQDSRGLGVKTELLRRAAVSAPGDGEAQSAHGLALCEGRQTAEGLSALRRAVALSPARPDALGNLAFGQIQAGNLREAVLLTARVRRIEPMASEPDAQDGLAMMLDGDFARAFALMRRAMALAPDHAGALIHTALVLHALGANDQSVRWSLRALRLDGNSAVARFNLSLTLLQRGDFARGWALYEARWRMGDGARPRHAPVWDGGPLDGRSILMVAEQGHGDTLHFVRYAGLLAERGARVGLAVQPLLKRLLAATPGVSACHALDEDTPAYDLCVPMLSVPGLVGTRLDNIPASIPYLRPDPRDAGRWKARLAEDGRLKVGLVWAGEARRDDVKANSVDRRRSLPLSAFAPLAGVAGVAFYSLQIGEPAAQAASPPPGLDLTDWTGELKDFADTAALVDQLDLVISVDTSVCHLAGGLGKPVWVLSRFDGCWRWLGHREDSPWYPTMRLFHQDAPGAWDAPVRRLAAALAEAAARHAAARAPSAPLQAATVPGLLARALTAHRGGRLAEAAAGYRRVLTLDPASGDALHLLGLTARSIPLVKRAIRAESARPAFRNSLGEFRRTQGQPALALPCFQTASALDPGYAEARINLAKLLGPAGLRAARHAVRLTPGLADGWRVLGSAECDAGLHGSAVNALHRALALDPADGEALGHLGRASLSLGRTTETEALHLRALRLAPDRAEAWRCLGDLRLKKGAHAAAEACLRHAIALQPDFPEALNNLGGALLGQRRFADARPPYGRAMALRPGYPDPWNNLGNALNEIGETASAQDHYRRALALDPAHPVAYANLAESLRSAAFSADDYAAVEVLCGRALTLVPGHIPALNVQSVTCLDRRRLDEAEAGFRRILDVTPDSPTARFNLSLVLLKSGRLREAWDHYEARWSLGELPVPRAPGALWNGEPLDGRSILLHAEQGNGDVLHFVRYAPLVAQRGGRVRLAVHGGLRRLMARIPGLLSVHGLHDPIPVTDLHCPLLSLPRAFRTGLDDIPAAMPYLTPDPEDAARWRARLPDDGRLRVGLVWSGDPRPHSPKANAVDRRRSLTLRDLAPLGRIRGGADRVAFHSLQKGAPAVQAKAPPDGLALTDWMDEVGDFADTAALIAGLDLVITVDTSVAHLAGGLGKPVWVLSRYDGCWRWLNGREDSPWYPTMTLFHQPEPGQWGPAVAAMARRLEGLVEGTGGG